MDVRKGQWPGSLSREEFGSRFREGFRDPAFSLAAAAISQLEQIAWEAYAGGRKSPVTRKAGPGFADPEYDLAIDWSETQQRLESAQRMQQDPSMPGRALVVCGSSRNDGTCPGEMSKTFRLAGSVRDELREAAIDVEFLDLSQLASEYGRRIHPCKGCVSTAMPLCHWPCSCYPNYALGQTGDWMAEIYEKWVRAHGVVLCTPVYWYQAPSPLKLMIDRLVCADGGNPDPTSTAGKDPARAKALELAGWDYPKHLAGRIYGLVVHGDVAGIEETRRALSDWLDWMGLIDAGRNSRLDRYIGYYRPYATSHEDLDADRAVVEEARNVARAVAHNITQMRAGRLARQDAPVVEPRKK